MPETRNKFPKNLMSRVDCALFFSVKIVIIEFLQFSGPVRYPAKRRPLISKRNENPVIGIDLGGTNFKIAVVAPDGAILADRVTPTPASRSWPDVLKALTDSTRQLLAESGLKPTSVGFAAPGMVDESRDFLRSAPNFPKWKNLPLRSELQETLELPVTLDNDVNAFGLAEALWGAGKGKQCLLGLTVGTGVGGSVIIDGKIFRGFRGAAGELGHILINEEGPLCNCGLAGHLEAYAGRAAFDKEASRLFPAGELPSPKLMAELAADGNEKAREVHRYLAHYLALGCASLIHCFNPEAIVIGGGTVVNAPYLFDVLCTEVDRYTMKTAREGVEILPAGLGYMAGVLGAAALRYQDLN
jgi:glucokinase